MADYSMASTYSQSGFVFGLCAVLIHAASRGSNMAMKTRVSYWEVEQANKPLSSVCKTSLIHVTKSSLRESNTRILD